LQHYACKNGGIEAIDDCPSPIDTTSHSFVWRLDTLGDGSASVLNDVFVIDENNVWAVGEIYLKDSSGNYSDPAYNAARWNGSKWNLLRIIVRDYGSATGYFPLKTVFGFAANDVWFAGDADLIQWNGTNFSSKAFFMTSIPFDGQVLKMWGVTSSSIYCVGRNGAIYFYNGTSWQKLNSGTTIDIFDVWGSTSCKGELQILAVASNGPEIPQAKKLLRIDGNTVTEIPSEGLPMDLASVWFTPSKKYFVGGDLLYSTSRLGSLWQQEPQQPNYYVSKVRATSLNDIVVCGGLGHLSHFNGASWRHYLGNEVPVIDGNYRSGAIHQKVIAAVGEIASGKAVAVIGRRN